MTRPSSCLPAEQQVADHKAGHGIDVGGVAPCPVTIVGADAELESENVAERELIHSKCLPDIRPVAPGVGAKEFFFTLQDAVSAIFGGAGLRRMAQIPLDPA